MLDKEKTLNLISEFVDAFFSNILDALKEKEEIVSLGEKSESFCRKYSKHIKKLNSKFFYTNFLNIQNIVEEKYNRFIKTAYSDINSNVIENFSTDIVAQYINLIEEKCGNLPESLSNVLLMISNIFSRDQNIYKYAKSRSEATDKCVSEFKNIINTEVTQFKEDIQKAANETEREFKESLNQIERESTKSSITILGIFSAIVLTFNAGVSFSSIVMENLISSSFYRALIITALLGLILGNTIMGLFLYLDRVRGAKTEKSETTKGKYKISIGFILVITDVFLVFTIIMTAVGWSNHWIEDRDKEVYAESSPVTTQADPNIDIDLNGSLYFETTTSDKQDEPKKNTDSTTQTTTVNNN